jgi:alpha-mannosidase
MSFATVQPENILLTTMKKAEDSDDTILRFYETTGKDSEAVIKLPDVPESAKETDLIENEVSDLHVHEDGIKVTSRKHEIKTLKVKLP